MRVKISTSNVPTSVLIACLLIVSSPSEVAGGTEAPPEGVIVSSHFVLLQFLKKCTLLAVRPDSEKVFSTLR